RQCDRHSSLIVGNDSEDSYAGSAASWRKNNSNRKMQTIPYPVYYVLVVNDGEILVGNYCSALIGGHQVGGPELNRQRSFRVMQDGSSRQRSLVPNWYIASV